MALAWLILFLGSWLRLLTISGLNFHHGATILALAPLLFVALQHFLPGLLRAPERSSFRWVLAGLTALAAIGFIRMTLLRFWDPAEWLPTIMMVLTGLGITLFASDEGLNDHGPGAWLWVSLWMLISARDPGLGLLGAGLAPLVFHWGKGSKRTPNQELGTPSLNWMLPLTLGLFLPKPWWDWGLQTDSALPLAAFGLGGALVLTSPFVNRLKALPGWAIMVALAATGLLYAPSWGLIWGAVMGIFAACAWDRLPDPQATQPIGAVAGFWILGILLSFTLQANAWLPGLGHLIWLGNWTSVP